MESIREIYRIGYGPSSSHTMGPRLAAESFLGRMPDAASYAVTLFGSLAATGKGHLTNQTLEEAFRGRKLEILSRPDVSLPRHPNALTFEARDATGAVLSTWTAYSVGGGKVIDDSYSAETARVYPFASMDEILAHCERNGRQFWQIVEEYEGRGIWDYLGEVWTVMRAAVKHGLANEGTLPGVLKLPRKARSYSLKAKAFAGSMKRRARLFAYALGVAEENAAGGRIATAPTCGSAGVLPAVLYLLNKDRKLVETDVLKALATGGLIGTIVKANASISGAEVGCQGEIGVACAMAGGAVTQISGGTFTQIEYSAEMGIEHHLGLTCDPVAGLVQIPCIERNAFAAARALDHNTFALLSDGRHRISFDEVVEVMKMTGRDLSSRYKETARGGLALVEKPPAEET
jgi:L-serine dehydratase